jgi:hypothetical protein
MHNRLKFIALILLLVFSFPLVYRPYHLLHDHDDHIHSTCCVLFDTNSEHAFSLPEESCSVCDYEFTIFDLTDNSKPAALFQTLLIQDTGLNPQVFAVSYHRTYFLRGPPVIS